MKTVNLIFCLLIVSFFDSTTENRIIKDEDFDKLLKGLPNLGSDSQEEQSDSSSESRELFGDEDEDILKNIFDFDDRSFVRDEDIDDVTEPSLPICGQPIIKPDVEDKIVNGKPARPHSWPWQVSLKRRNFDGTYSHSCGGSIISNNIVLTAAHCVFDYGKSELLVAAGAHFSIDDEVAIAKKIKSIRIHPLYTRNKTHILNDIVALILETPFTFQDSISPVCLPNKNPDLNSLCYTTGWGMTMGTGDSNILNQVRLPILSHEDCLKFDWKHIVPSHLCTGLQNSNGGTCEGDSGGPLVCYNPVNSRWHLQGITSFGYYCSYPGEPSVFTRVYSFMDWIKENTGVVPTSIQ